MRHTGWGLFFPLESPLWGTDLHMLDKTLPPHLSSPPPGISSPSAFFKQSPLDDANPTGSEQERSRCQANDRMSRWSFPPHQIEQQHAFQGQFWDIPSMLCALSTPPPPIYRRNYKEKDHCVFKAGGQGWTSRIWGYTRATHECPTMASLGRKWHCLGIVLVPVVTEASDLCSLPGNWSATKKGLLALLSRKWQHPCWPWWKRGRPGLPSEGC